MSVERGVGWRSATEGCPDSNLAWARMSLPVSRRTGCSRSFWPSRGVADALDVPASSGRCCFTAASRAAARCAITDVCWRGGGLGFGRGDALLREGRMPGGGEAVSTKRVGSVPTLGRSR